MTLFQIVLIVVVAFLSLIIAILCIMVRNLYRSKARAFLHLAQLKQDLNIVLRKLNQRDKAHQPPARPKEEPDQGASPSRWFHAQN